MHALIIEDEPLIALLIEDQLRARGYNSVDFAADEVTAVSAARRRRPDLITADIRLAEGSGIAAVAEIRRARPVPVIFITATAGEVGRPATGTIVLRKPFVVAELDRALAAADEIRAAQAREAPDGCTGASH